jgi:hypothetical protein
LKLYQRKEIRGVPLSAMLENRLIPAWVLVAVFGTANVAPNAKNARLHENICSTSEFVIHVCAVTIATVLVFGAGDAWKFALACAMVIGVSGSAIMVYSSSHKEQFAKLVAIDHALRERLPAAFEYGVFDRELESKVYVRDALDSELLRLARLVLDARAKSAEHSVAVAEVRFASLEQVNLALDLGGRTVEDYQHRVELLKEGEMLAAAR